MNGDKETRLFRDDPHRQRYEALCTMERARTALRDTAWRYGESGRDTRVGIELDVAAIVYSTARAAYERMREPLG